MTSTLKGVKCVLLTYQKLAREMLNYDPAAVLKALPYKLNLSVRWILPCSVLYVHWTFHVTTL
jgi:hypothetical protein